MNNESSKTKIRTRVLLAVFFVMIAVGGVIIYFNQAHNEFLNGKAAYEKLDYSSANKHFQQVIGFYRFASATNFSEAQRLIDAEIQPMLDAEQNLKNGNYEAALDVYLAFVSSYPKAPHKEYVKTQIAQTYLAWGDSLIQAGDYEGAIKNYLIISSRYKDQPLAEPAGKKVVEAYLQWGDGLVQAGDYEDAIDKYTILLTDYETPSMIQPATTRLATTYLKWGDALAQSTDFQSSIEKYRVVLHDYKDEPIAQTALENLVVAYDGLGQQLIEKKSFSAAMDIYILANAFSTDSTMQAKFEKAYKTAFAELLKDTGTDGQSVMDEALQKACEGKPGKSPVLGMSSDTLLGVQLCEGAGAIQLPEEWIAKTPGNFRFVVDIHSRVTQFASCSYTGGHTLLRTGEAKVVNIYDVQTGKQVDQKIYQGQDPPCPLTYAFSNNESVASINGGPVSVSDQELQNDLFRLLKPFVSTPAEISSTQVIPDIPIVPRGFLLPVSNTEFEIGEPVDRVLFSPDGKFLASGTSNKTVLWDIESGQKVREITGIASGDLAFTPDGKLLAIGVGDQNTIGFWNITSGEKAQTLEGYYGVMALSPDGKLLASVYYSSVRLWDIANATDVHVFKDQGAIFVRCITFSPDGKLLAIGNAPDDLIGVWDVETGNIVWEQKNPPKSYDTTFPGEIRSVVFSPDGKLLASGSGSGVINIWDASNGELVRTLEGHTDSILSVAFSPNGKVLASGSADDTIKFWDISNGVELYSFDFEEDITDTTIGGLNAVFSVAFSPDGKWFATGRMSSMVEVDSQSTYPNVLNLWELEDQFAP